MQLTIISFNIWDLPLWFVKNRKERIKKVADYLAASGADIICLQEAWTQSNRELFFQIMGAAGYTWAVAREASMLMGNGGLITFSKFPIVEKKFIPFSRLSAAFVEMFGAKGVLETDIETPSGMMAVFNTHLHMPSGASGQRIRLKQLKCAMQIIANNDNPAILAGDFNEDKLWEQQEFNSLLDAAHFKHPVSILQGLPPSYRKENEFVDIWANRDEESRRYDYIFVRNIGNLGFDVSTYEPRYLTPALSDHDPVCLTLLSK